MSTQPQPQVNQDERVHCIDCKYYNRHKEGLTKMGYCQRDSPIILPETNSKKGHFPITTITDWCGEGERL